MEQNSVLDSYSYVISMSIRSAVIVLWSDVWRIERCEVFTRRCIYTYYKYK